MPRILIAENDRHALSGLVEIFREEGFEVMGVDRGQKAQRALERERFHVLLIDPKMPDVNGMQLHQWTQPKAPRMKTIIMTDDCKTHEALGAMERGVYEYFNKPLNLDRLFDTIRKAVSSPSC